MPSGEHQHRKLMHSLQAALKMRKEFNRGQRVGRVSDSGRTLWSCEYEGNVNVVRATEPWRIFLPYLCDVVVYTGEIPIRGDTAKVREGGVVRAKVILNFFSGSPRLERLRIRT